MTSRSLSWLSRYLTPAGARCDCRTSPDTTEWPAILALANAHVLGPILAQRVADAPDAAVPDDVTDYLSLLLQLNAERNAALRAQAVEMVGALNAAGLRPLLLKGAITLFDRTDPLRRSRMMRDIDLLVPHRAQEDAARVLRQLGYAVHERYPSGHHAYGEFVRADTPGTVDLHTELIDPSYLLSADEMRSRALPLPSDDATATIPSPTDRMLHHLLHAQLHHMQQFYRGELRLNQVFEFALLGERLGHAIDWRFIAHRMAAHRLTVPLHSYLLAGERLFGMRWPLATAAEPRAARHVRRCLLQLRHPAVGRTLAPVGNIRGAFAWHRMNALYGHVGSMTARRLVHTWQFLRKKSMRQAMERLFRLQ